MNIHFFLTPKEMPDGIFEEWIPDDNPKMYSSGVGHNVLELASRLKARGHTVTLGHQPPSDASAVIFFKKHFLLRNDLTLEILKVAIRHPVILIRSDLEVDARLVFNPDLEVMPNRSILRGTNQVYIPPFPQRGLIRREKLNGNRIENLEIKCNPENVPDYLELLVVEVNALDPAITVKVDAPSSADGSDNNWNDFSKVDLSLIIRPVGENPGSNARKPPTRLINAWVAGTIPLVDPLPAYTDLIRDEIDGFIVENPEQVVAVVKKLAENPEYCEEVFENCRRRGEDYQVNELLEIWEQSIINIANETKRGGRRATRILLEFLKTYIRR
jgi:hypothetical protein